MSETKSNDTERESFSQQAEETSPGIMREFLDFLMENKKWWLAPIRYGHHRQPHGGPLVDHYGGRIVPPQSRRGDLGGSRSEEGHGDTGRQLPPPRKRRQKRDEEGHAQQ